MDPVRVKLYGFFPMTRRSYLTQLAVGAALLLILLAVWANLPPLKKDPPKLPENVQPREAAESSQDTLLNNPGVLLLYNIHWIVLAMAVLFGIEAFFVLRRFAREEAAQRARQGKDTPTTK